MRTTGRGIGRRRGAGAAELAVILPVLTTVALGCVDFGRFAYHYIALQNAARAGAEYATTNSYTSQTTWTAKVQAAAAAEMDGQTGFDSAGLATTVTPTVESGTGLRRVQVTVTYTGFSTVFSWPGVPSAPTMKASVVMRSIR